MESEASDPREARLADLLGEYLDRRSAGEEVTEGLIQAEHPDIALELIEELRNLYAIDSGGEAQDTRRTLGDYTLRRQIGRGGMGMVYEAWQGSMDRVVALKVLPPGVAADNKAFVRFMREAKTAGQLSHPNVVAVYSTGVEEGTPWYSMEYVEGETLAQIVASMRGAAADASTAFGTNRDEQEFYLRVARAFGEVADGLQHAHSKGVVHRDIKPSNLILERPVDNGDSISARLRILDFGLARLEGQESLSATGDVVGTPLYMSPEQARRKKIPLDHRTDVYSLGATLYEVLTLEPPFRGKDHEDTLSQIITRDPRAPRQLNPRVPRDLETIVLKCLRKEPGDRYGTAEALGQDLRRFVRGDPIEARAQSTIERMVARALRRKWRIALAGAGVLLLAVCGGLLLLLARERSIARKYRSVECDGLLVSGAMLVIRGEMGRPWSEEVGANQRLGLLVPKELQAFIEERARRAVQTASERVRAAIALCPDRFDAHYFCGRTSAWLGHLREAEAALWKSLELRPGFVPALRLLDEVRGGASRAGLDQIVTADAWEIAWARARRRVEGKRWEEALLAYEDLVEIEERAQGPYPGSAVETLLARGDIRLRTGDLEGAKSDAWAARAHALERGEEMLEPALLLAKVYVRANQEGEAEKLLDRLWQRSPDKEDVAVWATMVLTALGARDSALMWARRIVQEPSRSILIADLESAAGNCEAALRARRRLVEARPERSGWLVALGRELLRCLWVRGQGKVKDEGSPEFTELLATGRRAMELAPGELGALSLVRDIALCRGEIEEALSLYRRGVAVATRGKNEGSRRTDPMNLSEITVLTTFAVAAAAKGSEIEVAGAFDEPVILESLGWEVNSPYVEGQAAPSGDDLSLAFGSNRPRGQGGFDVYIAERDSPEDPFASPRQASEVNTTNDDWPTFLSEDGLTLYYMSASGGNFDMYYASRGSREEPFVPLGPIPGINSRDQDGGLSLTADGLEAYFVSQRAGGKGGRDLWLATRRSIDEAFSHVRNMAEVNSEYDESYPSISSDGLVLFWADMGDSRPGGFGGRDIWFASRTSREEPFGAPVNLGSPINSSLSDHSPRISAAWPADGAVLYLTRCMSCQGDYDLYRAVWRRDPRPKFIRADCNEDGSVDVSDAVCLLLVLFVGAEPPGCIAALDTNGDSTIDISDAVITLAHLFLGGGPPAAPFPECGFYTLSPDFSLECITPPGGCAH